MQLPPVTPSRLETGVRWLARLLTVLVVGLVLLIFVGEGFNPLDLKGVEVVQMIFFWTACIGMVLAWRWQVIGGAISLGAMMLFITVEFVVTGRLPGGFFYLMLLPGLLFWMDAFLRRSMSIG
jgi:hypothetical protein